jgi:Phosphotransferase system, mannose/fructose/N-acetylgalactosamine-specific component IIB
MKMIQCLRIDDRLLHGQIVTKWLTHYDLDAIVIADDSVINDEISKMALRMAKPEGTKMSIKSVDEAITLLNNPATTNMKIFVLVKNTDAARRIVDKVSDVKVINIGGMRNSVDGAKPLLGVIKATPADIDNITYMKSKVSEIDVRTVPSDPKKDISKYL